MSVVVKIVNVIVARSSLIHRQFNDFLIEIEAEYGDLLLYAEVRWLNRENVLNRFVILIVAIQNFFENEIYFKLHVEQIDGRKFRCLYQVENNNIPT